MCPGVLAGQQVQKKHFILLYFFNISELQLKDSLCTHSLWNLVSELLVFG